MDVEEALPAEAGPLGRSLRVTSARERGVGPQQLRWIGTDPELFEVFYREHVEAIQRFVTRRVGERERGADLTAEIFLAAIESAQRYRARAGTPKAWLFGIARALVANDQRRRGREQVREARFRGSALLDEEDAARMDERLDAAAKSRELYAAMDRLPEAERAVLELVALDEMTVAEAAAAAGVRPVTARVRLHRARSKRQPAAGLRGRVPAGRRSEDRDLQPRRRRRTRTGSGGRRHQSPVTWLPPGKFCREPHFTPSIVKLPGGGGFGGFTMSGPGEALTITVGDTESWRKRREAKANLNLDPAAFGPDQSVVISGSPVPYNGDPKGGYEARLGIAEGQVGPCKPISAAATRIGSIRTPAGAVGAPSEAAPRQGQYLYEKTKVVQLQGWEPDGPGTGSKDSPRHFTANLLGPEADALPALVPTLKEAWTAPDGRTREREVLGQVEFLSQDDQERWEAEGSPQPFAYDPAEHQVHLVNGHPVKEYGRATGAAATPSPTSTSSRSCPPNQRRCAWRSKTVAAGGPLSTPRLPIQRSEP